MMAPSDAFETLISIPICFQKQKDKFEYFLAELKLNTRVVSYIHKDKLHSNFANLNNKSAQESYVLNESISIENTWREVTFRILVTTIIAFGTIVGSSLSALIKKVSNCHIVFGKNIITATVTYSNFELVKMERNEIPHSKCGRHVYEIRDSCLTPDEKKSSCEQKKLFNHHLKEIQANPNAAEETVHMDTVPYDTSQTYEKKLLNLSVVGTSSALSISPNQLLTPDTDQLSHEQNKQMQCGNNNYFALLRNISEFDTSPTYQELKDCPTTVTVQRGNTYCNKITKHAISNNLGYKAMLMSSEMQDISLPENSVRKNLSIPDDKENCSIFDPGSRSVNASSNNESNRSDSDFKENQTSFTKQALPQSLIDSSNKQSSPNAQDLPPNSTEKISNMMPAKTMAPNHNSKYGTAGRYAKQQRESPKHCAFNDNSKIENTYFRFPGVDIFTPPNSAYIFQQSSTEKENEYEISNMASCISPEESPLTDITQLSQHQRSSAADSESSSEHNSNNCCTATEIKKCANSHRPGSAFSTRRVDRRTRLKSISLDSEGARLIEENFTNSIPVEELVEIAANQSYRTGSENDLQLQSKIHHQILNSSDDNYKMYKNRNKFNLTLNLNDKDNTLTTEKECRISEFHIECSDYDDYNDNYNNYDKKKEHSEQFSTIGECFIERVKRQHSQLQSSKIPPLIRTRKKASSLDSDYSLNDVPRQLATCSLLDNDEGKTVIRGVSSKPYSSLMPTSSLSVPTTPKRQPYRLHQQYGIFKSNLYSCGDNSFNTHNNTVSERYLLWGFQQKFKKFDEKIDASSKLVDSGNKASNIKTSPSEIAQRRELNSSVSNVNLKTLPEIFPVSTFENSKKLQKSHVQTLSKSRSSILQRRGSNHSLTLNLDIVSCCGNLSKRLSASNYSLGNYKGSRLSLVGSSCNLQQQSQQLQDSNQSKVQTLHTKQNLLQRRGSNTSLVLNLKESNSSLNHYTSHNSLNTQHQQSVRPIKKGLLERRNSNTNLTLFSIQNCELSASNCNLPGSICSLSSIASYYTQNEQLKQEEDEYHEVINTVHRAPFNAISESHLSPSCQQHTGRRKFLSSDSLNDIVNTRLACCCQQRETCIDPSHTYNIGQTDNYSGCTNNMENHNVFQRIDCVCVAKSNIVALDRLNTSSNDIFKLKTTVISTASTNNLTQFTCCEFCCCNCGDALSGGTNTMSISNTNVRKITTEPLSPQTTTEDFKIYLANIQFLQNASNLLSQSYIQNLHRIFVRSYCKSDKISNGCDELTDTRTDKFSNQVADHDQLGRDSKKMTKSTISYDNSDIMTNEEQRKMILKIHQEFWDLPTNYQEKPMVFGSQSKNRYRTILPNENSRFILEAELGMKAEPYINANLIKGPDYTKNNYIATQGPMNNTIYEFWLMVHQNINKTAVKHGAKALEVEQKIVMLTDFVENNRQKCSVYFPMQYNESVLFSNAVNSSAILSSVNHVGIVEETLASLENTEFKRIIVDNYFIITNLGVCYKNGYSLRKLLVIYGYHQNCEMMENRHVFIVYHYWFPDWPDHRSPEDIDVLLDMSLDILDQDCSRDFNSITSFTNTRRICTLPIIHCSAGIGRTGCLLAILNGLNQMRYSLKSSKIDPVCFNEASGKSSVSVTSIVDEEQQPTTLTWKRGEQVCVDILGIVCNLRLQRGGMVQNSEQYELIHRALCLYLQKLCVNRSN